MSMNPKDIFGPTAVLVIVAAVFTALVVGTNGLTEEKIAIARYAASLVDDGDFVYIDA